MGRREEKGRRDWRERKNGDILNILSTALNLT